MWYPDQYSLAHQMRNLTSPSPFTIQTATPWYQDLLGPLPHSRDASETGAPRVCHELVIDDGSSAEERSAML